ncbi:MAG: bifunctional phosphoserine phosphatase/homoserine phosphotransferase ThrH [Anaerolineales bacterium]|nr:bifunctional phosphoserine phosphatase/homoserine phosphotransferase ThrH [Anaerolineales bacterium]
MKSKPTLAAMDMEGVFTPEIWIEVSKKTGIEKLRLTTRDVSDYDVLMRGRLQLLKENNLTLKDIQSVISTLAPLPGAVEFINWLETRSTLIILTDSFYQFVAPLKEKMGNPTIFCNQLITNGHNQVVDYVLRQRDGKKHAVLAFKSIGFRVVAVGDSYNDTSMLLEADNGILFRPSENIVADFPQFSAVYEYEELQAKMIEYGI